MDEGKIKAVEAVLMKYCVPNKEHDGTPPKEVAAALIEAVENYKPATE